MDVTFQKIQTSKKYSRAELSQKLLYSSAAPNLSCDVSSLLIDAP